MNEAEKISLDRRLRLLPGSFYGKEPIWAQ